MNTWGENRKHGDLLGHPATCGPDGTTPDGKCWHHMPGDSALTQRLNFFFYRRGLMADTEEEDDGQISTTSSRRNKRLHREGRLNAGRPRKERGAGI